MIGEWVVSMFLDLFPLLPFTQCNVGFPFPRLLICSPIAMEQSKHFANRRCRLGFLIYEMQRPKAEQAFYNVQNINLKCS